MCSWKPHFLDSNPFRSFALPPGHCCFPRTLASPPFLSLFSTHPLDYTLPRHSRNNGSPASPRLLTWRLDASLDGTHFHLLTFHLLQWEVSGRKPIGPIYWARAYCMPFFIIVFLFSVILFLVQLKPWAKQTLEATWWGPHRGRLGERIANTSHQRTS